MLPERCNKPDFEVLRDERNRAVWKVLEAACKKMGIPISEARHNFDYDACYCACPKGPCEHDFQGWREFKEGNGGEQVCNRCGMGAMAHTLRTAE